MRWALALLLVSIAACALFFLPVDPCTFARGSRDAATRRGLAFIYRTALVPKNFAQYGHDYLWCFCAVARTSAEPELKEMARRFGRERALQWRAEHPQIPQDAGANAVFELISGSQAADCLGVSDEPLKAAIRQAAGRVSPEQVFGFDPAKEPPPDNVPKRCRKCEAVSPRGTRACEVCGTSLEMWDRYELWCDAIISAFMCDRYGVRMGSSFEDVAQWLPRMSPYPGPGDAGEARYRHAAYAITHLVYAFSDYSRFRLRPEWFPREFRFLTSHFMHNIEAEDPELVGEYLDTLRSFGLNESDPEVAAGIRFLMTRQNLDGSWGDPNDSDIYNRYHTTWTAIDGLRAYARQGESVTFPEALCRSGFRAERWCKGLY
jgi:hypothetical protein